MSRGSLESFGVREKLRHCANLDANGKKSLSSSSCGGREGWTVFSLLWLWDNHGH